MFISYSNKDTCLQSNKHTDFRDILLMLLLGHFEDWKLDLFCIYVCVCVFHEYIIVFKAAQRCACESQ